MKTTLASRVHLLSYPHALWSIAACAAISLVSLHADAASSGTVITIAGNGTMGFSGDGGPATNAAIGEVEALAIGPDGTIYFVDGNNYRIRAIDPVTGHIRTVAGNGVEGDGGPSGPATNASLSTIPSLAVDRSRNVLYLSDTHNMFVRKLDLVNGNLSVYAGTGTIGFTGDGGPATSARLRSPWGLATDAAGRLSIAAQHRVRQVNPITGIISTIAGGNNSDFSPDGFPAVSTSFHGITELAADPAGNVFIFEGFSNEPRFVRRVDVVSGLVSTVAGGGTNATGTGMATNMQFIDMFDIAVSAAGELFIAMNFELFRVDLATGLIAPIAGDGTQGFGGDGGSALSAQFNSMAALAVIPGGGVVVADMYNYRIRYIAPNSINLTNDSAQRSFSLPWVNALSGNLILENNSHLTNINLAALTSVSGDLVLGGNVAAGNLDLGSLESAGSVAVSGNTAAGVLDLSSLATVSGDLVIEGNSSAGVLDFGSLESANNVSVSGNTAAGVLDLGSLATVAGDLVIEGNSSAGNLDLGSLAAVSGDLTIQSNAPAGVLDLNSLTGYGCGTNEVTMTLDGGTVQMTNGLTLCTNATLTGSTTVDGSVTNNGTIEPGSSPGRLNITGHLHLTSASRLHLEIGGYASNQYDVVNVGGSATLGGALSVSLFGDFKWVMTNGASFTLLTAGTSLSGSFANVAPGALLTTTDGYARFVMRSSGFDSVRLTGLQIVDTDSDSMPDWWEDQFGLSKTNAADADLDMDGDGASNAAEFAAGTNPLSATSTFRFASIAIETNGVRLTWNAVGGKTYRVQTNGPLPGEFADNGLFINVPGTGEITTTIVDSAPTTNTRFYRLRLEP